MNTIKLMLVVAVMTKTSLAFAAEGPGQHFLQNWDLDENGEVTVEEARERRSDIFASFDSNDDGFLDDGEYKTFDAAREADRAENEPKGQGKRRRSPASLMGLDINDIDGDGKVSAGEFLENSAGWIDMIDRNGDGVVTIDDFGPKWNNRDGRIRLGG